MVVKGHMIKCIIDSGSQVSILPVRVLINLRIHDLMGSKNDGVILYIGYFETNVAVEDQIIDNVWLLLVDNDNMCIIGMNIIGKLRNENIARRLG